LPKNKKLYQLIAVEPMMTLSMEESSRLSAACQSRLFMVMATVEYDYDPDDHYAKLGMEMQKYLADMCILEELAQAIQNYWANVSPVQRGFDYLL
jgi:hypothetical protein